jgi:methylenetetrahydrofolate dehydrogenase (NADP+)/methenyltetrahydrofolate cyclohydrolase
LGEKAEYMSATAEAIDWLLSGYGIDLAGKKITLLGEGKLVGGPLSKMWSERGYAVTVLTRTSEYIDDKLLASEVIVSATGQPKILHSDNVPKGAVVVDAGTVSEDGVIVGDSAPELQVRQDLIITPPKGGVGPLTIVLMFDHVIRACLKRIG